MEEDLCLTVHANTLHYISNNKSSYYEMLLYTFMSIGDLSKLAKLKFEFHLQN